MTGKIPDATLDLRLTGVNLVPGTLRNPLEGGPSPADLPAELRVYAAMMPGAFLVEGGRVLWRHDYRHAGEHPDFARIPEILAEGR